ncbi:MAG: biotin--[acetyl-CoA-carboxylase] ligase [Phycisphaerales bacterium]|nr:biotin--[acetyl-CoA-carboxylase] ligase [Phycisphaerae bacterium]NNF43104.1 biotin--[acetyl-CoA-carboxylase] ligase [Phycisphaerales bacterium]NNM27342.1 biotin--[acetyl-CoA-carboxylase] ligase [Phycisphaerales bacterium]
MIERFQLDRVDSTNLEARRRVERGLITSTAWITARTQSAGRGTHQRRWASPRDAGLYATFIRVGAVSRPVTAEYTRAAGVACVEAIAAATGVSVRLKSINDLCAGGGKVGGILTEAVVEAGVMKTLLIGVGINVLAAFRPVAKGALPAIALADLRSPDDAAIDPAALESAVLNRLATWVRRVEEHGGCQSTEQAWMRHAVDPVARRV